MQINALADMVEPKMTKSAHSRPIKITDNLFGFQHVKPKTPTPNCARCGKFFAAPKRTGRPERYCGPECRKAAKLAMTSRFSIDHRGQNLTPGACRACGKAIVIGRRPGRFPYFCSPACKRLGTRPTLPRGPDLFADAVNTQPERKHP